MRCRGFLPLSDTGVPVLDERLEPADCRGTATSGSSVSMTHIARVVRVVGRMLMMLADEEGGVGGILLTVLKPVDVVVEPEQFPNWTAGLQIGFDG